MSRLWQAAEPELTELGERAERAIRFSWFSDPWVEAERHDPDSCICYLLPIFFNHVSFDARRGTGPCGCTGCEEVRQRWRPTAWQAACPCGKVEHGLDGKEAATGWYTHHRAHDCPGRTLSGEVMF